ncbi:MAG: hypothetical protein KME15_05680 [Drouetiella hepatica Uher 2000/2452]|uniref:Uncharacterized protein n=1 Tax=Drouetiella hepatica Uher 2000/2452 TaxID=904376 RepID=A0A951QB64_9CYAN|nr:hypothetical protein [Drouetiella hepatica Uher 2000/2452]
MASPIRYDAIAPTSAGTSRNFHRLFEAPLRALYSAFPCFLDPPHG